MERNGSIVKSNIKMIIIYVMRTVMHLLQLFPIKQNRIIFNAYRGSQYSCNPKYISEYLNDHYPSKFEIIWAFNDVNKFKYLENDNIKLVKFNSLKRFYYEATCKISINNVGSFSWIPRRMGQEHVNTWHAGFGYKKIGLGESVNDDLMKKTIQISSNETTLITSTSKEFTQDIAKSDLGYKGKILECGYPRNDVLFKQKYNDINLYLKVTKYFGITKDAYIVLYAPTWRYDKGTIPFAFDFRRVIDTFKEKYNKDVIVLSRMHHLTKKNINSTNNVIDATYYPDMQELLAVADALITDYSSSIWDYSVMEKPIYIHTNDIVQYEKNRGYHLAVKEWGFPISTSDDELVSNINKMTSDFARKAAQKHRLYAGDFENGTACKQISEFILNKCENE